MKLILLFGAGAVGKMTVGQELMKITDLRLFHGHMSIEPVIEVFGHFHVAAIERIREVIFDEFAKSHQYGMIFTYMWPFDSQFAWDYIDGLADIFRQQGADIYYIELVAAQEVRLQRHTTENRLNNKASKRDLEWSTALLLREDEKYRLVSRDGEISFENYIKIDNTSLPPDVVAQTIKDKFCL